MNRITVISELKKEFSGSFKKVSNLMRSKLVSRPKTIFSLMIAFLAVSLVFCFSLLRHEINPLVEEKKVFSHIDSGVSQIGSTALKLKQVLEIQASLKAILQKDSLNNADSLMIRSLLARLEKIQLHKN